MICENDVGTQGVKGFGEEPTRSGFHIGSWGLWGLVRFLITWWGGLQCVSLYLEMPLWEGGSFLGPWLQGSHLDGEDAECQNLDTFTLIAPALVFGFYNFYNHNCWYICRLASSLNIFDIITLSVKYGQFKCAEAWFVCENSKIFTAQISRMSFPRRGHTGVPHRGISIAFFVFVLSVKQAIKSVPAEGLMK